MQIRNKAQSKHVAKLVLEGLSNKQIATSLNIKEKTVKFHITKIFKLNEVRSRSEYIVKFYKAKEITPDTTRLAY